MKVRCVHGYFFFMEEKLGELSEFVSTYGLDIVPCDEYYTFAKNKKCPGLSIADFKYVDTGVLAPVTHEGTPWEVMRANALIYDFNDDKIKPLKSVPNRLNLTNASEYFYSDGLLLPGSLNSAGQRVTDYSGYFTADGSYFRYTEVLYDQTL